MINDAAIGRIVSAIPAMTVAGLGLAIAHAYGMLSPFDRNWISWLTVSDLATLTWGLLPMIAIGALGSSLFHATETPTQRERRWDKDEKFAKSKWSLVVDIAGYLCLLVPPLIAIVSLDFILRADRFLPIIAFAHLWGVARLPLRMARAEKLTTIAVTCFTYIFILGAMFTGYLRGEAARSAEMLARVTLENGTVLCQREVYSGQRALMLYDRVHDETTTVAADQVARVVKTKDCWKTPGK